MRDKALIVLVFTAGSLALAFFNGQGISWGLIAILAVFWTIFVAIFGRNLHR